jgi:protein TonB
MVAGPLLLSSVLPEPAGAVRAFFVDPVVAPPPPPPPPPVRRPATARARPEAPPDRSGAFTAPIEVPAELRPEEGLDLGIEGGVSGGVEGGVPGGVLGGVVGGLPDSVVAAPPPVTPLRVGSHVKEPVKLTHVDPVYPKIAIDARIQGVVIIEAVIDTSGRVTEAKVLRGVPLLDQAALEAVRQWVYTPTLVDGIPTPIVLVITVIFERGRAPAN